jgi:hypothetical protein
MTVTANIGRRRVRIYPEEGARLTHTDLENIGKDLKVGATKGGLLLKAGKGADWELMRPPVKPIQTTLL